MITASGVSNCLVLAPDNFTGTIASSYTESEWSTVEKSGFVCLPPSPFRHIYTSGKMDFGNSGYQYWTSTSSVNNDEYAVELEFTSSSSVLDNVTRDNGEAIRLVKTVQ